MKLTINDRAAFVRAVMNDLPQTDYVEEARKILLADIVPRLPPKVLACWKDPETRGYVKCDRGVSTPVGVVYVPGMYGEIRKETLKALDALDAPCRAQKESFFKLRSEVKALISACSTLKQAQERLPEFSKYLPAERAPAPKQNPLMVATTVADLTKAGWPK